jgi:hypothetical protein
MENLSALETKLGKLESQQMHDSMQTVLAARSKSKSKHHRPHQLSFSPPHVHFVEHLPCMTKKPQIESENRNRSKRKQQQTNKRQALNKQNQWRLSRAEHNMQNTALQIYQEKQLIQNVIYRSKKVEIKPPYVWPGCSNHTYNNNMINRCHVQ